MSGKVCEREKRERGRKRNSWGVSDGEREGGGREREREREREFETHCIFNKSFTSLFLWSKTHVTSITLSDI